MCLPHILTHTCVYWFPTCASIRRCLISIMELFRDSFSLGKKASSSSSRVFDFLMIKWEIWSFKECSDSTAVETERESKKQEWNHARGSQHNFFLVWDECHLLWRSVAGNNWSPWPPLDSPERISKGITQTWGWGPEQHVESVPAHCRVGGNEVVFKDTSNQNHSRILWFISNLKLQVTLEVKIRKKIKSVSWLPAQRPSPSDVQGTRTPENTKDGSWKNCLFIS